MGGGEEGKHKRRGWEVRKANKGGGGKEGEGKRRKDGEEEEGNTQGGG